MDAINQIEAMLDEAIAALIHLDAEQLEAIELRLSARRLSATSVSLPQASVPGTSAPATSVQASSIVQARLALLGQTLAMTEINLSVLERIAASRRVSVV